MTGAAARRRDPRALRDERGIRRPSAVAATDGSPGAAAWSEPTGGVLVVLDTADGRLSKAGLATVAAGRALADALGRPLLASVGGGFDIDRLGDLGVDAVVVTAAAPAALVAAIRPRHVLFPDSGPTATSGRAFAAATGQHVAVRVVAIEGDTVVGRAAEPGMDSVAPLPPVLLVDETFPVPLRLPSRTPTLLDHTNLPASAPDPRIVDLGIERVPAGRVPLAEAPFVVAGGAGVTDWDLFRDLVAELGATPGGSRVVCDAGHLPRDRQVGASGVAVSARLYLALGISGAVQHLEGIVACGRVVSVNLDPTCAMVGRADLTVVADVGAVMRALVALARGTDA